MVRLIPAQTIVFPLSNTISSVRTLFTKEFSSRMSLIQFTPLIQLSFARRYPVPQRGLYHANNPFRFPLYVLFGYNSSKAVYQYSNQTTVWCNHKQQLILVKILLSTILECIRNYGKQLKLLETTRTLPLKDYLKLGTYKVFKRQSQMYSSCFIMLLYHFG